MSTVKNTRPIPIITACMRRDGLPTFVRTEVEVTDDQADNGIQFYLAEAELLEKGYEEPFVHFAEDEAPAFLFPAVEKFPGVETETIVLSLSEDS